MDHDTLNEFVKHKNREEEDKEREGKGRGEKKGSRLEGGDISLRGLNFFSLLNTHSYTRVGSHLFIYLELSSSDLSIFFWCFMRSGEESVYLSFIYLFFSFLLVAPVRPRSAHVSGCPY